MDLDKILESLSESRVKSYSNSGSWSAIDKQEAISKYLKNLNSYQMIVRPLHIFEVSFRNKIHSEIGRQLGLKNWLQELKDPADNETTSSLNGILPSTVIQERTFQHFETNRWRQAFKSKTLKQIKNVLKDIQRECTRPNNPKVVDNQDHLEDILVSRLNFGFWTQFTQNAISRLIDRRLNQYIFPTHPNTTNIPTEIDEIRKFRNKVFHHEPLRVNIITWDEKIWLYVSYICIDTRNFFHPFSHR